MRIAFFCDGTWNDPASNTNVCRLYNATLQIAGEQNAGYDSGVGVDGNPLDHLFGGAFGAGLFNKIKDGYTRIAHLYSPGDEIFLFGFSRGAYTARCLAGMIAICGLPTQNVDQLCVDTAFQAYRDAEDRAMLLATLNNYAMDAPTLKMVGVWDTVGSLGIPSLWGGIDPVQYGFLSPQLHPDVENAYQALAIDEQRGQFPATLWLGPFNPNQVVEQVWFTGVHSDVGGGYTPDPNDNGTRLADITLGWMMGKAQALGLVFDPSMAAKFVQPNGESVLGGCYAVDVAHDSHTGLYSLTTRAHRPIAASSTESPTVSNSVRVRCQNNATYRPVNLALVGSGVPDPGTYSIEDTVLETTPLTW